MTKPIQVKNMSLGEGIPKICVPITGKTEEEIKEEGKKAVEAGAELVEWRADFFEALEDRTALEKMLLSLSDILGQVPLLFTIRTSKEGGNREIRIKDYVNYNIDAARSGKADLIDVEVFGDEQEKVNLIQSLHEINAIVVASSHDFFKTDIREILLERFKIMDRTGADILKMAVMPNEFADVAAIMQATCDMAENFTEKPLISMAMGEEGMISRIAGENFGSCITFGTVGEASAPGQLPLRELKRMMNALHVKNEED